MARGQLKQELLDRLLASEGVRRTRFEDTLAPEADGEGRSFMGRTLSQKLSALRRRQIRLRAGWKDATSRR